ncbi:Helix-loop-helix DNA-binding domain [Popillia japonica]|uniref:Protein max n=1 Tax=Popillia japonica TaxID=7064 RepID=A0AAW1JXQ8_POPJA
MDINWLKHVINLVVTTSDVTNVDLSSLSSKFELLFFLLTTAFYVQSICDFWYTKCEIKSYKTGVKTTMSDDDRDIDVESDEGEDSDSRQPAPRQTSGNQYFSQAEKRAHHNALERKRRDHIKDSFSSLRDSVPELNGEKVASRAQILKKAAEYIQTMRRKNNSHQQDIENLKRQNDLLEAQIRTLEKAKAAGTYRMDHLDGKDSNFNETESDTSDMESTVNHRRPKKLKTTLYH